MGAKVATRVKLRATPIHLTRAHILLIGPSPVGDIPTERPTIEDLDAAVRANPMVQEAAADEAVKVITADAEIALIFPDDFPLAIRCAVEISRRQRGSVRMGIHTGPVTFHDGISGSGVDLSRRVLECGDAGHILLAESAGLRVERMGGWIPLLKDYGFCSLEGGDKLRVFSLRGENVGNHCLPRALQPMSLNRGPTPRENPGWALEARSPALIVLWSTVAFCVMLAVGWFVSPTFRSLIQESYGPKKRPVQIVESPLVR